MNRKSKEEEEEEEWHEVEWDGAHFAQEVRRRMLPSQKPIKKGKPNEKQID